eukprot:6460316-Amphidinium_carterae.1
MRCFLSSDPCVTTLKHVLCVAGRGFLFGGPERLGDRPWDNLRGKRIANISNSSVRRRRGSLSHCAQALCASGCGRLELRLVTWFVSVFLLASEEGEAVSVVKGADASGHLQLLQKFAAVECSLY